MKDTKYIKHENIMSKSDADRSGLNRFRFECRGCCMTTKRRDIWDGFRTSNSWISEDNSFLTLEEEPENEHDPNAVAVVARGEFFGTAGYVGREYCKEVKAILAECRSYRVEVLDEEKIGDKTLELELIWCAQPQSAPEAPSRGRPKEDRETKRRVSLAVLPSVYEDLQKVAYVQRKSVSEIMQELMEGYIADHEGELKLYPELKERE